MFLGITCSVITALIILFRVGWFDRFVYALIQILLAILIIGRIACEKTTCFWEMVKWYFAQLSIIKYVPCKEKDCEADWSLRGGIDEAGLILTGVFFFVTVLFVKNVKLTDLVKNISKITLLGAFEAELLDQKVTKYSKKELDKIDQDVIKRFEKIEDKIIEKTNTVEERLLLLDREINEVLRDLYEKLVPAENNSNRRIVDTDAIIQKLDENKVLEQELINHLKDFNSKVYTNAFRLGGKRSNGLSITGSKILKLLLVKRKQIFQKKRVFYQGVEKIAIERPSFYLNNEAKRIEVEATIFMVDVNDNSFPLVNLDMENFRVEETVGLETHLIKPEKVEKTTTGKTYLNLILMVDCSTSMENERKLELSKDAAIKFLQRINSLNNLTCHVAVYRISTEHKGFIANRWFSSTESELYENILNLKMGGGTPLFSSIQDTLNWVNKINLQGNNMVICLTDGESDGEDLILEDILELVQNTKTPIISIGFGQEEYSAMKKISEQSGAGGPGVGYFIGAESNEIYRIFEDISESIACSYRISWLPKFENQDEVDLKLRVMYKDGEGEEHHDVYDIVLPKKGEKI